MIKDNQTIEFLNFHNTSLGELVFSEMVTKVVEFVKEKPESRYQVMIGSDSKGLSELDLVSVVAVHRVGEGGRYFWHRSSVAKVYNLRQKIYSEVDASLKLASVFLPSFRRELLIKGDKEKLPFDFQIHVDVGEKGETKALVHEITGMVTAYGYHVLIKPQSAAASTFADRHVR